MHCVVNIVKEESVLYCYYWHLNALEIFFLFENCYFNFFLDARRNPYQLDVRQN